MKLKIGFLTPLIVEDLSDRNWRLVAPFLTQVTGDENTWIEVPKGFETDFASVPRLPIIYSLFGNRAQKPAVLHDYLYSHGGMEKDKEFADEVFFAAMETNGNPWYQRYLMYAAVRMFGGAAFNYPRINKE